MNGILKTNKNGSVDLEVGTLIWGVVHQPMPAVAKQGIIIEKNESDSGYLYYSILVDGKVTKDCFCQLIGSKDFFLTEADAIERAKNYNFIKNPTMFRILKNGNLKAANIQMKVYNTSSEINMLTEYMNKTTNKIEIEE